MKTYTCTYTDVFITKWEDNTQLVVISVSGHVIIAAIYNQFIPLPILYSLCFQQSPRLVMVFSWLGDLNLHS